MVDGGTAKPPTITSVPAETAAMREREARTIFKGIFVARVNIIVVAITAPFMSRAWP